jgi:hypothetical protein
VHSSTQQTPFMVDTGRHPHIGFEPQQPHSNLESANEFVEHMTQGLEEVKAALTKVKMSMPCTTTIGTSLLWSSHQGTESGWMEAILLPTDCHLNCLTDV